MGNILRFGAWPTPRTRQNLGARELVLKQPVDRVLVMKLIVAKKVKLKHLKIKETTLSKTKMREQTYQHRSMIGSAIVPQHSRSQGTSSVPDVVRQAQGYLRFGS